jgi:hypothetical protein
LLITESYRELNSLLHRTNPAFGMSGRKYAAAVLNICEAYGSKDVLDYGCGKRTLEAALGFPITNYDPCIPGLDQAPRPHAIVACTDVLEHIEPDCLDEVLRDIRRVTKKAAFLLVATRPAMKTLADGRNAHLIQQTFPWWRVSLQDAGLKIKQVQELKGEFVVLCE